MTTNLLTLNSSKTEFLLIGLKQIGGHTPPDNPQVTTTL